MSKSKISSLDEILLDDDDDNDGEIDDDYDDNKEDFIWKDGIDNDHSEL